jgi:hypothetical protein
VAILEALAAGNDEALNALFGRDELTTCSLTLLSRADFEEALGDPDVRAEAKASPNGQRICELLDRSPLCYNLRTSAGRNRDAVKWQEHLWYAIASVAGGVVEDPQFGTFRLVEPSLQVPDPFPVPKWRLLKAHLRLALGYAQLWLRRLMNRARRGRPTIG